MTDTTSHVAVARPRLFLGGQEQEALAEGLLELRVSERIDGLASCEATFGNWGTKDDAPGFLYFDRALLDFGKAFKIQLGDDVAFDGLIGALEGGFTDGGSPTIAVLAEDRYQELRMTRRTRTWADSSDADVAQAIASDHGLTPDVDLSGPTHHVIAQLNQSDLAFLRERARALDAELALTDGKLTVKTRAGRGQDKVTLGYGNELREVRVTADLAGQRTSLNLTGWDVAGKSAISEQAGDDVLGAELGSDSSGASVLRSAFGERKEAIVDGVPLTSDEARARVGAAFKARARRFVVAHGVAQPAAKLRVGSKVELKNVGPLFSGVYYVVATCLRFDGLHGLRVEFTAERPGLGAAA